VCNEFDWRRDPPPPPHRTRADCGTRQSRILSRPREGQSSLRSPPGRPVDRHSRSFRRSPGTGDNREDPPRLRPLSRRLPRHALTSRLPLASAVTLCSAETCLPSRSDARRGSGRSVAKAGAPGPPSLLRRFGAATALTRHRAVAGGGRWLAGRQRRRVARPAGLEPAAPGLEGPLSDRLCQGGHTSGTGNWPWSPDIGRQSRCRPCFAAEGDNRYERGLPALRYIDECSRVLGGDEQECPCGT